MKTYCAQNAGKFLDTHFIQSYKIGGG